MQSPDRNQLWCPSQSLWSLIAEHVPGSELPTIRRALGDSLIDMYIDEHSEAEMWYEVWQDSQQANKSSRAGTPLADPPAVKELVRAEVKMLLQTLREKAGRDGVELIYQDKPEAVDYALGHLDRSHRNSFSPEVIHCRSRPSSHCSVRSNAEDEFEAIRERLNVTDIGIVVERLRSVLLEESKSLKRLIKNLKGNIKHICRSQCDKPEPSLAELKDLRGAIQRQLKLYPSSFANLPSTSSSRPLKSLKPRHRLPAGKLETLQDLSITSVARPHPPPPLCHTKPRPPSTAPPSRPSTFAKLIKRPSLSLTLGQQTGGRSASTGLMKKQTALSNRSTSSGHDNGQYAHTMVQTSGHSSLSPEQDNAGLQCRTPTSSRSFHISSKNLVNPQNLSIMPSQSKWKV